MRSLWGHCYENVYSAFFAIPDLFSPDGTFVEGWLVFEDGEHRVVLMEHGWIVSNNQHIVDPTIVLMIGPAQPLFYFPGVVRSWLETDALNNELFPHVRFSSFGEDGMGHSGYKGAYAAAQRQAHTLLTPAKQFIEVRASDISTEAMKTEVSTAMAAVLLVVHQQETGGGQETR